MDDEGAEEEARVKPASDKQIARVQPLLAELAKLQQTGLQDFLHQEVVPSVTEAVVQICRGRPDDPVHQLAAYLEQACEAAKEQRSAGAA